MKFEPIAEYIETEIPAMKRGTTLFINMMPTTATYGALLKDSFAGTEIDGYIPDLRSGRFQLSTRASTYEQAKALCEEISTLLTMNYVDFVGMTVKTCRPLSEPIPYMPSVGNLVEFSVNFSVIYGIVTE